jgi:hypothetical protein
MRQTAVEWLLENLISEPHSEKDFKYNSECWEKALEMEEEQHGYNWVNCKKIIYEGFVYIKYSDLLECEKSFNNCT